MSREGSLKSMNVTLMLERQGGERLSFNRLPIRIGRRGYNDLTVRDPRVSSEHCVIELGVIESSVLSSEEKGDRDEPCVTLRDLNSRNGTLLKRNTQELMISHEQPVILQRGDECWLGDRHDPVRLTLVELSFVPVEELVEEPTVHQHIFEGLISELERLEEPHALLEHVVARTLTQAHELKEHREALSAYLGARLTCASRHEALRSAAEELVTNHERLKRAFDAQRALIEEEDGVEEGHRVEDRHGVRASVTPSALALLGEPSRAQLLSLPLEQLITLDLPFKLLISTFEERAIRARLERCDDNRTHAAQSLELSRQAIQSKLAKWRELD